MAVTARTDGGRWWGTRLLKETNAGTLRRWRPPAYSAWQLPPPHRHRLPDRVSRLQGRPAQTPQAMPFPRLTPPPPPPPPRAAIPRRCPTAHETHITCNQKARSQGQEDEHNTIRTSHLPSTYPSTRYTQEGKKERRTKQGATQAVPPEKTLVRRPNTRQTPGRISDRNPVSRCHACKGCRHSC